MTKERKKRRKFQPFKGRPTWEREYFRDLHDTIDLCFALAAARGWDVQEFASRAKVSPQTIYYHSKHAILWPTRRVVWSLVRACGVRDGDAGIRSSLNAELRKLKPAMQAVMA